MTNLPSSFILALGTCLVLCLTVRAQDESDGDPSATILISSPYSTLQAGQSLQLTASVWGTNDTTVNWLVNGTQGGDSADGTISSDGLYTAPTTVPSSPVTITAQSADVWSAFANATITVVPAIATESHSVTLSWTGTTSSVVGYYIYRGAQSSGPFSRVNDSPDPATTYTDDTVVSGETYYYATTAVDSGGTESEYSNVAQAVIP